MARDRFEAPLHTDHLPGSGSYFRIVPHSDSRGDGTAQGSGLIDAHCLHRMVHHVRKHLRPNVRTCHTARQANGRNRLPPRCEQFVKMVAVDSEKKVIPPCGRCREFISQINDENRACQVLLDNGRVAAIGELLPDPWN